MDTDRNLRGGVLARQAAPIAAREFAEACTLWATCKDCPLADLLVERGWIQPEDRDHVDYLLSRKLEKYGGDARAGLATVPVEVRRSLAAVEDESIRRSLADPEDNGSSAQLTADDTRGRRDRYTLTRLHELGGIGQVWLAHDPELGREVALKELRPDRAASPAHRARFLREAQITGQLEHPGVVPVYELARPPDGDEPYYTMRFVRGRTLTEAAEDFHKRRAEGRSQQLDLLTLLNAFVVVCNTIAYAHARGILHRDIKGQNVVLGDFGEVVLLDWGLAKPIGRPEEAEVAPVLLRDPEVAGATQTIQGQAVGTPAYMSPEQAGGRLDRIDRRSDVYGLGAMLYEILTGRAPFSGASTREVLRKVQREEPVRPAQLWPEVPPALESACLKGLAKDPAERFGSAAEFARVVQQWV